MYRRHDEASVPRLHETQLVVVSRLRHCAMFQVLCRHGGIHADADTLCVRPIEVKEQGPSSVDTY